MASLAQWTAWKDEYIVGLRQIIDDAPYALAKIMTTPGHTFELTAAKKIVKEAEENGFLDKNDPLYFWKAAFFSSSKLASLQDGNQLFLEVINDSYNSKDYQHFIHNTFSGYYTIVLYGLFKPLIKVCRYYLFNNPLAYKNALQRVFERLELKPNFAYCRLRKVELFDYLKELSPFCLHNLLAELECPYAEEIFDAIQDKEFETFKSICYEKNIDFSELSEIVGYMLNGMISNLDRYIETDGALENPDLTDYERISRRLKPLASMVGLGTITEDEYNNTYVGNDVVDELVNFECMFEEEDEKKCISMTAFDTSLFYPYIETMGEEELEQINRLFGNPYLHAFLRLCQYYCVRMQRRFPEKTALFFTKEEQEVILSYIESPESQPLDSLQLVSEEKTLASRWMTEPYQRMTDNTLVELLSQKIWPQLSSEVDGLQWTPAKRALPTFPKTKNMLAACILFHALELAKIAKLPKQEDDEVSDVDYMSAEDRAQAGISATSNRNAGITHTKKKYNDTLPVGYMKVLERFIPEEELPGRTTSRTYLKLVNKWVKMKLESVRDNIDSEASAKLFIAECKSDLGPQFYLYQDNRIKMKALLKEWKDQLPDIFNVPI